MIFLEISGSGEIKAVKVRIENKEHTKYLMEIANQIDVIKPAMKNGESIGTRFAFKIDF